VKVKLRGRYDLRLGFLSDLHFSDAFVVRSNPALDVMNIDVGLVYHLGGSRKKQ
jgi:calcineurin-like phosphoesterase family protein